MALPSSANRSEFASLVLKASHQCETIRVAIRCVRRHASDELYWIFRKAQEPILESVEQTLRLVSHAMKLRLSPGMTTEGFRVEALRDSAAFEQFLASQASMSEELAGLAGHPAFNNQTIAAAPSGSPSVHNIRGTALAGRGNCDCSPIPLARWYPRARNPRANKGFRPRQRQGWSCSMERTVCNMARNEQGVRKELDATETIVGLIQDHLAKLGFAVHIQRWTNVMAKLSELSLPALEKLFHELEVTLEPNKASELVIHAIATSNDEPK
jgi:hypothetical protein